MNPEKDYLSDIQPDENFGYTLASRWARLGAAIAESILIYIPIYFIASFLPFENLINTSLFRYDFFDIGPSLIQIVTSVALGAIFYPLWSGNLGHRMLGLKVISAVDGSDYNTASAGAIREVLKNVLGTFLIPSIWLLWDYKKQNLYDKITKTLVVYKL